MSADFKDRGGGVSHEVIDLSFIEGLAFVALANPHFTTPHRNNCRTNAVEEVRPPSWPILQRPPECDVPAKKLRAESSGALVVKLARTSEASEQKAGEVFSFISNRSLVSAAFAIAAVAIAVMI